MNVTTIITQLKKLTLCEDKNYKKAADFFLEQFALNTKVKNRGRAYTIKHDYFKALLLPILKHQGSSVKVKDIYLLHLKENQFTHGVGLLNTNKMLMLYYFEDIHQGLVVITHLDGTTDYYRIQTLQADCDLSGFSKPSTDKETLH